MNLAINIQNFSSKAKGIFLKTIVMAVLFLSSDKSLMAQDCNIIMACNDLVQVSLGNNCTETIMPDMILEGQPYPNNFYDVVVKTANGTVITNDIVTKNHIGKTFQVVVTLSGCDLSCWGTILVEDKLPPVITNCPDVTVDCGESTAPNSLPKPSATDACTTVTLTSTEREVISQCSDTYVKVISRTWTATDLYGNKSSCTQTISVTRPTIEDVSFPENYDDVDNPAFECGDVDKLLPNGAPHPDVTGYPEGVGCPNIMYFYEDIIFNICGNANKVLRQWTVIDWCTGRDTVGVQVIKIHDTTPPLVPNPNLDSMVVSTTDPGLCTGTWKVPDPLVVECSDWDYVVGYKLADEFGNPVGAEFEFNKNIVKTTNSDGSYYYTIKNLPTKLSWIKYIITDACGNSTPLFREVIVADDEAPTPVCEGFTVVTLKENGWADVFAESIDDHSSDNCGIVKFEVKRLENKCSLPEDLQFGEDVNFCCADVSSNPLVYQRVQLRVYDAKGNFADCIANVKVQDKKNPTIEDIPDVTIECGVNYQDTTKTGGRPTAIDNCGVTITFTDAGTLTCGQGKITRTWRATDPQGNFVTSTQVITVQDSDPFGEDDITWPADLEIDGCTQNDAKPDLLNSKPTYVNSDCADIAISWDDEFFSVPGACLKIIRTWRVINWCNANTQNPAYIIHKQKITLKNSTSPVFVSGCTNRTINSPENDCEEYVEHSVTATDDCTPALSLKYTWEYDEDNNGTVDQTGTGSFYARVYPAGKHKMTFKVVDICGNISTCSYTFHIKDNKPPTPICNAEVVWVVDNLGQAEVWASDFDLKSADFCDGDNLKFSFNAAGTQPARTFTCADIPNGKEVSIPLKMYVIDTDGNSEFCDVVLRLQDSPLTNACLNTNLTANVSGKVINKQTEGFESIEVSMEDMATQTLSNSMTTDLGEFSFADVPSNNEYQLHPSKNDDIINGVSTLDLVLIQRHILNIKSLDNPYDLLSADANNDKKVTASDLVAIRKVILGSESKFPNQDAWRFLPANYTFADPRIPFEAPRYINLSDLSEDKKDVDFISVKIGDVNNSATYSASTQKAEPRTESFGLTFSNKQFKNGEIITVPVSVTNEYVMTGLQFELNFDNNNLELIDFNSSVIKIEDHNYVVDRGSLKTSISLDKAVTLEDESTVFTLTFKARKDGSISTLGLNDGFENEAYDEKLQLRKISIDNKNGENEDYVTTALSNYPNPFSEETSISFHSNIVGNSKIILTDVAGKQITVKNIQTLAGWNKVRISKSDLNGKSGVYIYQIENNGTLQTGRMILSE